jgi:predicted RecA/RadA family phage recombinase
MRSVIAATVAVAAGLFVANMLGVAAAEAPTGPTQLRSVSVEGVANVPIAQSANLATATAVYRQAMANALADGQGKAEFLAGKAAVALAGVQSIVEGGGSIGCTTNEESAYAEYLGERPDFGSPVTSSVPLRASAAPASPSIHKPTAKHLKKAPIAKKASVVTCTLTAQVALVYAIS